MRKRRNVPPNVVRPHRRFVHLRFQVLDLPVVLFQRRADRLFEVVDQRKVREERQDVLDLEQTVRLLEEGYSFSDVLAFRAILCALL